MKTEALFICSLRRCKLTLEKYNGTDPSILEVPAPYADAIRRFTDDVPEHRGCYIILGNLSVGVIDSIKHTYNQAGESINSKVYFYVNDPQESTAKQMADITKILTKTYCVTDVPNYTGGTSCIKSLETYV